MGACRKERGVGKIEEAPAEHHHLRVQHLKDVVEPYACYSTEFKSIIGTLDPNIRYLVYCRTGIRGAAAAQIMRDLSFKQVQNLIGGLAQWILDSYPTVV
jgi:rhodanese-related sulfurtransferase